MQLRSSFSALIAGLLVSLQLVDAASSPAGLVTLPLKRVEPNVLEVHPQIRLQQHINRGVRRLSRMTGQDAPSSEELISLLQKRVDAIENAGDVVKRFNRFGIPTRMDVPQRNKNDTEPGTASTMPSAATSVTGASPSSTSKVTSAIPPTAPDSLGLDIEYNDVGYQATLQIGTPPRNFSILVDTGSADTWVGSEECISVECGGHNLLGPKSSSSFHNTTVPWSIMYGSGGAYGYIVTDNIVIAGLALNAHSFGVAKGEYLNYNAPFDGLMGLAQSSLSDQKVPTPIDSLVSAGLVAEPVTSYKLSRRGDGKNDGEITFGGLDQTKFQAKTLTTLPNVNTQGFWGATMDGVSVNGNKLGINASSVIFDTGTTLMMAPPADATAIHKAIPGGKSDGMGGFTVPCNTSASVALSFGGNSFTIDPRDIVTLGPFNITDPTSDCISGITEVDFGNGQWLLGDVFLKNVYFSTDVGKNTSSLAKLMEE